MFSSIISKALHTTKIFFISIIDIMKNDRPQKVPLRDGSAKIESHATLLAKDMIELLWQQSNLRGKEEVMFRPGQNNSLLRVRSLSICTDYLGTCGLKSESRADAILEQRLCVDWEDPREYGDVRANCSVNLWRDVYSTQHYSASRLSCPCHYFDRFD